MVLLQNLPLMIYKKLLTTGIIFSFFLSQNISAQTMPLYINFNSHNEISDHIIYSNSATWNQYRGIVLALADTFHAHNAKWNLQCESDFILADITRENGYANPNDLLDSLDNSATVEVDPHNHFDSVTTSMTYNPYNYPDLAHLLDSAGLAYPRKNMGGFLWATATDWMPYQNPVAGYTFSNYSWNPNVIWGAGSPNHTSDYNGYGVWKPQGGNISFFTHDPSKHLTFIGNGCSFVIFDTTHVATIVNQVAEMIQYIQYQPYSSMAMYTASIQMNFRNIASPGFVDTVAAIVRALQPYVNSGQIIYQTLTEKYTTWYAAHSVATDHWKTDCQGLPLEVQNSETENSFEIFPNPATDYLTINFSEKIKSIEILNAEGKLEMKKDVAENTGSCFIDVSDLPPGLYFAVTESDGERSCKKFVKQ